MDMDQVLFTDVMDEGVTLSDDSVTAGDVRKHYPDYLRVDDRVVLTPDSRVDPSSLKPCCAYTYKQNLYLTDDEGNIAYIDCEMVLTPDAASIRAKHPEYKLVGGGHAANEGMDAGHFGIQLGQHPSIAMEQNSYMNRWGIWRQYELWWAQLLREGHSVNVKAVFTQGEEGTYSDFWCVRETIDGDEVNEFVLTNDSDQ